MSDEAPTDISELFSRNPLDLTKDDISLMVAKLRESRKQFNAGNATAGKVKKTPKQKAIDELSAKLNITLDL